MGHLNAQIATTVLFIVAAYRALNLLATCAVLTSAAGSDFPLAKSLLNSVLDMIGNGNMSPEQRQDHMALVKLMTHRKLGVRFGVLIDTRLVTAMFAPTVSIATSMVTVILTRWNE